MSVPADRRATRDPDAVSVVIPTFNRAHLVRDALDSVAAQTLRPLEVIVVDDGSTDGTPEAVAEWLLSAPEDISVRVVIQANAGGNVARNRGADEAAGGVIAFLDSDDLWWPEKLERQMAVLNRSPAIGAVYCGVREVDVESVRAADAPARSYPQGDLFGQLLVRDVTAPTSTLLVRRDVFRAAGAFDTDLQARQDWDMWIRLSGIARIGAAPEPLVDLRSHSGPRTISDPTRELVAHRRILEKYAALRAERGWRVRLPALAAYHRRAGRVSLRHMGAPIRALRHFATSIAVWPFDPDSYFALIGAFVPDRLRRSVRGAWNSVFGATFLSIRSH